QGEAVLGGVAHALSRLELRPLVCRQAVPLLVPGADRRRAIDLGQAIDVGDAEVLLLQRLEDGGPWWRGGGHGVGAARGGSRRPGQRSRKSTSRCNGTSAVSRGRSDGCRSATGWRCRRPPAPR